MAERGGRAGEGSCGVAGPGRLPHSLIASIIRKSRPAKRASCQFPRMIRQLFGCFLKSAMLQCDMPRDARTEEVALPEPNHLGHRLLFASIGLLAGEGVIAIIMEGQPLWQHFLIAAIIGWACVGLPLVLPLPSRLISQATWPVVVFAGACLGPLALASMFVATALLQAVLGFGLATFSLRGLFAGTGFLWPMASLVSTVAIAVYSALIRRSYRRITAP
jgi:hypothetical protein